MIVNPGIILGPGFWDKGSSKLFSTIKKGLMFYTKGGTGYVDVRDVVEVVVELACPGLDPGSKELAPDLIRGRKVERACPGLDPGSNGRKVERYCLVGANVYFKDFFFMVADALGVKRPSIKAGPFLSGLAWRMGTFKARISGSYPLITRGTAESANRISFYSSEKVKKELGFEFREIEETVQWCCKFLR